MAVPYTAGDSAPCEQIGASKREPDRGTGAVGRVLVLCLTAVAYNRVITGLADRWKFPFQINCNAFPFQSDLLT